MTEEQIERWYEREMDVLDHNLMVGALSQAEYNKASKELIQEVNAMYHELRNPNCRF
jgi:hypothetical protein